MSCLRIYQDKSHFFSAKHPYYKNKKTHRRESRDEHTAHTGHAGAQGYLAGTGMDSGDTCVFKCSRGVQAAQSTSTACAKRMMALGGTPADLSMLSSKPAGSAIDVNEAHSRKADSPMLVMPAGSAIDVNEAHQQKADSPMLVIPAGSAIEVNAEHSQKA